jgi:hypothetical protein
MKKEPPGAQKGARQNDPARGQPPGMTALRKDDATGVDHRAAQRHDRQSQAAELSAANVEESPHMDRGDSALGTGESLSHGRDSAAEAEQAAESLRRGALDTQYGTKSSMKTGQPAGSPSGATAETAKGGDRAPPAPNPGSSEPASGAERDTMTGPRPVRDA